MVEPGASVHPQGPVRAGTREDSEGAVGERQTPGTSQHVYTQSPAETQEDSEEAVGERQTPGPSQPVHPQSPAGTLEDSEVAVGGRLSPEPSRPVHSQTSAETRKDSEGAAGGRHTPEPTEKTIEELVKNIYTLVELGYVGQADHGLPMPTDRQLILQLKEFSGFQRYINPPPTLVQAQTKTSIDLHEGWHQVASSQHLPRPHFPISKQQYHIQLTQQWSIN